MYKFITALGLCLILTFAAASYAFNILYPLKYFDIIEKYADKYNHPAVLICAVIHAESRFDPDAVSKKGASGLMQIAQITADWAAEELPLENYSYADIHEPELNILIGCWFLDKLNKQFGGDADTVLAAYNAGSGNVSKWLNSDEYSKDGVALDYAAFGETRAYIKKVNDNIKIYGRILYWHDIRNKK